MTKKESTYKILYKSIGSLVEGESDNVANMANVTAAIKEVFGFLWVGFYLVGEEFLVLGPFQGPVACTRIKKGKGVCGTAWETGKSIIVPDVHEFPGHIACSSRSKSEIVVPVFDGDKIAGVLDIDSEFPDSFDDIDQKYLSMIAGLLKFN